MRISDWSSDVCSSDLTEDCLPMLNHISFGVADLARSRTFYDAVLKPLGLACTSPGDTSLGYGDAAGAIPLWLLAAKKPVRAEAQNGLHEIGRASCRARVCQYV